MDHALCRDFSSSKFMNFDRYWCCSTPPSKPQTVGIGRLRGAGDMGRHKKKARSRERQDGVEKVKSSPARAAHIDSHHKWTKI